MYIVFDTETTGKARNFNARYTDTNNWPRMVQLAWQEYDENGNMMREFDLIVKPDGYVIPDEAIAIHRITNEKAHGLGISLSEVLDEFNKAIDRNKILIAHNIKFDNNVVACEMHRLNKAIKILLLTTNILTDVHSLPPHLGGCEGCAWVLEAGV